MLKADSAKVERNPETKRWTIRIQIGEEVIKRSFPKDSDDADEAALRSLAVKTATDEGYELDAGRVEVVR